MNVARILCSAPDQVHALLDGESGVRDDVTECSRPNLPVIRDDNAGMWHGPPNDHVTACLPPESEGRAFQGR